MQRIGAWRVAVILFTFALAVMCILPSFSSYYGTMFGYLDAPLQKKDGVGAPAIGDEGIEFTLGASPGKTLRNQYRDFANTVRTRAAAVGLQDAAVNGAKAPIEDAARVQNKALFTYTDPQNRTPEQILEQMQLFGKLPASLRWLFPTTRLNLGLDLKGGVYLVLELDMKAAQQDTLDNLQTNVRNNLREQYFVNCREVRREEDALIVVIQPSAKWGAEGDTKKTGRRAVSERNRRRSGGAAQRTERRTRTG